MRNQTIRLINYANSLRPKVTRLLTGHLPQFLRYSAVSLISFSLNFALPVIFVEVFGYNPAIVVPIVFAGMAIVNFTLHRMVVFESNGDVVTQSLQYLGSNLAFRLFDYGFIMVLVYATPLPFPIIIGGVLAIGFVVKFFLFRLIFRQQTNV